MTTCPRCGMALADPPAGDDPNKEDDAPPRRALWAYPEGHDPNYPEELPPHKRAPADEPEDTQRMPAQFQEGDDALDELLAGDAPRAYTKEECIDEFLHHLAGIARYWAEDVESKTPLERCNGVAFSFLCVLDGVSMGYPALDVALSPHPDDKEFHQSEGENWYEPGMIINDQDMLHERWHKIASARDPGQTVAVKRVAEALRGKCALSEEQAFEMAIAAIEALVGRRPKGD